MDDLFGVDWYNYRRLHTTCGNVPLAEYETAYYGQEEPATLAEKI
jgi:putative transposase